jgi:predicted amidohydrolase YtcJ
VRWWADANANRLWVTGGGWNYELFPGGLPTRQLLDTMVPDRPAFLTAHDGQTGWANSAALKLAGITRRTPNPPDGVIVKDPRSGEPTGALKRSAMNLVTTLLPKPTREQRLAALRDVIEQAHRLGVTSMQTVSGSAEDLDLYDELRRNGELEVRVYASLSAEPGITAAQLDTLGRLREKYGDDPLFKAGAVTLSVDAESSAPGSTEPPLDTLVADLDRRGWQVVIHAMGDRAVRMAVDAFQYVTSQDTGAPRERRHRLEPLSGQAPEAVADASVASQPPAASPQPWIDAREVPELAAISKAGVAVSLQPGVADPLLGLQIAANTTAPDGEPRREWSAAERRGLAKAIDAYTRDAAWASFDEHRKGTLKRDMLADIVVLSRDIFTVSPSRLADTEVTVTIFNGKVVFSRAAETNE